MAGTKMMAMAMLLLGDAIYCWETDYLLIYHLKDGRDGKAKEVNRSTVSETELAQMTRSINLQLENVPRGNL